MGQAYSDPKREPDPYALPDLEVFYVGKHTPADECPICPLYGDDEGPGIHDEGCYGWYWQSCFPGCLPDGEPNGPFATEAEALADAREGIED